MLSKFWKARGYRYKILVLLAMTILPLWGVVMFYALPVVHTSLYNDRKASLRASVDLATNIIEHYYSQVATNELTEKRAQELAIAAIERLRYHGSEYFWINDLHPKMIMHPFKPELNGSDLSENKDPNGTRLFVEFVKVASTDQGEGIVAYLWPKPGYDKPVPKLSFVRQFKPWKWVIGTGVYTDDVDAAMAEIKSKVLLSFGTAFIIAFSVFFMFAGRLMAFLTKTVSDTDAATQQVLEASNLLSNSGQNIAQGAVESSVKIEETLRSVHELKQTVEANQERSQKAAELAKTSEQEAAQGATEIKRLIGAINEMASRSKEITSAMDIIDDIAFQTNLLALNAAVEAARAGEQGKGFAVVAEAVRNLALKSAEAAKEVKAVINGSVMETEKSLTLARASDTVLDSIVSSVQKVNVLNQEIAVTTNQQSQGIQEIYSSMGALERQTQAFSAAAEETAASSEEMSAQANNLSLMVEGMAKEVIGRKVA